MTPVYRPETFSRDVLFAAHDLLGWAAEFADEDLGQGGTEEARALAELHAEAGGQIADLSDGDVGPDDPVRSVRVAIAMLELAEADEPRAGWGEVGALLERLLWARGPARLPRHGCYGCGGHVGDDGTPDASGDGLLCGGCADACTTPLAEEGCPCVGVSADAVPYGCVRPAGHAEHHVSPDGWRWESGDLAPDFTCEAIVLGRDGSHDKEIPW